MNAVTYILTCVKIEVYRNKSETIKIKILIHACIRMGKILLCAHLLVNIKYTRTDKMPVMHLNKTIIIR